MVIILGHGFLCGKGAAALPPITGWVRASQRALEAWPQIDFVDDHNGCLFTVTVQRKPVEELQLAIGSPNSSGKSSGNRES